MKFVKMHGCGNDYVYVNCIEQKIENPSELSIKISDRHFGIGSDGLILIKESEKADFRMEMYNADGSQAEMCGNGIRCLAKYVYDRKLTQKKSIQVETKGGIRTIEVQEQGGRVFSATVDMGEPVTKASNIPVIFSKEVVISEKMTVGDTEVEVTCVGMGNPHAVIFVEDTEHLVIEELGPLLEKHKNFPEKTNVEFVQVINESVIKMRVWERGSGETLACGTGACASVAACILNGKTNDEVEVQLLGGTLQIRYDRIKDTIFMTGPAEEVFEGEYKAD